MSVVVLRDHSSEVCMKFQQIRSATSIVTFGGKRFLIDPMLAQQGAYPEVPL